MALEKMSWQAVWSWRLGRKHLKKGIPDFFVYFMFWV
jgi:hypothetical protein